MSSGELRDTLQKHLGVYRVLPLTELEDQSHNVVMARRKVMRLAFELSQSIVSLTAFLEPFAGDYNITHNVVEEEVPQVIAAVSSAEPSEVAGDVIATSGLMKATVDEGADLVNAMGAELPALAGIANNLAALYGFSTSDSTYPDTLNPALLEVTDRGMKIQPIATRVLETYIANV